MSRRLISGTVLTVLVAFGASGCSGDSQEPSAGSTATGSPSNAETEAGGGDAAAGAESATGATEGAEPDDVPSSTTAPDPVEPTGSSAETAQPTKKGRQNAVFGRVPGGASGACVTVGRKRDVRSGGIVGGPFDTAVSTWKTKQPGKPKRTARLYWVPLHAAKMPGVTVVATHRSTGVTVKETKDSFGEAEQWKFYDTYLELPTAGTWQLRVKAGPDEGCFVMRIPR